MVTLTTQKDVRSYPCRSMESAIKLAERFIAGVTKAIEEDLDPRRTGKVFNVLGDVFPANRLEKMIREMYARNQMTEEIIKQRIVEEVDTP